MATPNQLDSRGLILGDGYPLASLVGTIHQIRRAATHGGDWSTIGDLCKTMEWQLSNLDNLRHPYATRVREILAEHGCNPSRGSFLKDDVGNQLHHVKLGVYRLIQEIEEKSGAKTKIIPFVEHAKETEDASPVEKAA